MQTINHEFNQQASSQKENLLKKQLDLIAKETDNKEIEFETHKKTLINMKHLERLDYAVLKCSIYEK